MLVEGEQSMDDPAVTTRLLGMAKEFAEKFPDFSRGNQLLYQIGQNAVAAEQYDTAKEALQFIADREGDSQMGKIIAAKIHLLETIGKPPEIAGSTLEGTEIDLASLKGRVVLVDFWATWCEPCVTELPNLKAVYEKYHEQGFDVLAISLDTRKSDLVGFVEQNKLPWPQIFFDENGKREWDNPLGQKYGIDGIPATLLVDRDGNLRKIGVRGSMLEPAVVELLKPTTRREPSLRP
jgi:thiol-disulfide isomerase/thioredoxin